MSSTQLPGAIKPVEDKRLLGIGFVLIACFLFSGLDTSAKWLSASGMSPFQVAFFRHFFTIFIMLGAFLPREGKALLVTRSWKLEILRGLFLLGTSLLNFFAVKYLPLTITGSILFTMPLLICALSVPLLGEPVGWRRWTAIGIGFVGVLIIIQPGGANFQWAMLFSLASVTCNALYNITNRKLAGVDNPSTQQIYGAVLASAILAPIAISVWVWPHDLTGWLAVFATGILGTIGHFLMSSSARLGPAAVLSPFNYSQIIYMTILSWLVFNQPPTMWIFIGAPIVIGSGLYIWLRERQLSKPQMLEEPNR